MRYFLIAIAFIAAILLPKSADAVYVQQHPQNMVLIVSKGKRVIKYKAGSFVRIRYTEQSRKMTGRLVKISSDSIFIEDKKHETHSIAISDIESVMKIHQSDRKGWVSLLGIIAGLSIAGIYVVERKSLLSHIALAFPILSLYTYLPYLLFSFMTDIFSKKSKKKEWLFTARAE